MCGAKLDILARKALSQDDLNYMVWLAPPLVLRLASMYRSDLSARLQHDIGHGFDSFLNIHECPQSFSSDTVLIPGYVIINKPGLCKFFAARYVAAGI